MPYKIIINSYFSIMSRSLLYWIIHKWIQYIQVLIFKVSFLAEAQIDIMIRVILVFVFYWFLNKDRMTLVSICIALARKILKIHCWNNVAKRSLRNVSAILYCSIVYATLKCCSNIATNFCAVREFIHCWNLFCNVIFSFKKTSCIWVCSYAHSCVIIYF